MVEADHHIKLARLDRQAPGLPKDAVRRVRARDWQAQGARARDRG